MHKDRDRDQAILKQTRRELQTVKCQYEDYQNAMHKRAELDTDHFKSLEHEVTTLRQ